MQKLEHYDEADLINNPFVVNMRIPVTSVMNYKQFRVDGDVKMPARYTIERTPSTRLYHAPGALEYLSSLSDRATKMLCYLMLTLQPGRDYIQLNEERYCQLFAIKSRVTYLAAIKELVTHCYIARTNYRTVFFINPNRFFAGDRIKKFPSNLSQVQERDVNE